ncbi:uncharacterized protein isoform X2 [Leptinotarsa decemlineata]|uniref:uncharacterized protein isoform X2 n=1 Tax=Leptinotarsa decemlineata TaxID=7539 RepID=UPI003D30C881
MRASATFPPFAHPCLHPEESATQHSVRRLKSTLAVQSTPAQSSPVKKQNFEMASNTNTQEINNAVASIMPVVKEKAATSSGRGCCLSPELIQADRVVKKVIQQPTATTYSSPDLFEEEDRVVKKVVGRPLVRA